MKATTREGQGGEDRLPVLLSTAVCFDSTLRDKRPGEPR